MLGLLDEFLVGSPSPRIRMIADMGWAMEERDVGDVLLEFEARANFVHPTHQHVVICVYNTARFGADFVIDVMRTHPMALIGGVLQLIGGVLQVNPFFVPATEFLEELRAGNRLAPDG